MAGEGQNGFVTRFAPSPTGYLHRGHAFSALTVAKAAREAGGRWLLRIEDIDASRCRPEFEVSIQEDLAWLGLVWEKPVRRQSEHLSDYQAALSRLRDDGLLYRCFRTRQQVLDEIGRAPHGPQEAFSGGPLPWREEEARLQAGEPFAWRLSIAAARARLGVAFETLAYTDLEDGVVAARPERSGDVVLARKDVGVAYHLACVLDDGIQGVTHVIRGEDLREAAHIQRLLQALLGLPTPLYGHHRLLTGPDGRKFSKRDHAQSLRDIRATGVGAADLRAELGISQP
jgi:glutamyl-Q tRNA(Asp) synthetase